MAISSSRTFPPKASIDESFVAVFVNCVSVPICCSSLLSYFLASSLWGSDEDETRGRSTVDDC